MANTRPTRGQLVTVRCSGQLDDGTLVDEYDSLQLCIGEDDFIPGMHLTPLRVRACYKHADNFSTWL